MTKTSHYTNYGVSMQPREADVDGYLHFREGFESLPEEQWTEAEAWIADQLERIRAWQEQG